MSTHLSGEDGTLQLFTFATRGSISSALFASEKAFIAFSLLISEPSNVRDEVFAFSAPLHSTGYEKCMHAEQWGSGYASVGKIDRIAFFFFPGGKGGT